MQNVSQEQAAEVMPLSLVERTVFWREPSLMGMECLSATFVTHAFAPHAHDTFSIGAIENGSQIATIRGRREASGPGDLYLINPGEFHDGVPGSEGYRYRMIYPDAGLLREILEDVTGRALHPSPAFSRQILHDAPLAAAFHHAHRTLERRVGALEADESIYTVLAAMFLRHGSLILQPIDTQEATAVARARDYLRAHFRQDVGLVELARIAGLSRAHLIRAFRRAYHVTPHAYLTDCRIREARRLLRLGATPSAVAFDCGFADQAHFTRHFKARSGLTPGQFRAR
ncbi:AraC family transcriptional regulator [Rhizobium sp. PP-F2F-G48]|uniref:AraC family transcriptional regulator n=1 Tax=Rhizobium sp. PP-F2F-G48 TaxID=2135651 RepID=UPI0010506DA1|nr:AraC family transcriptional regulator [Rhizobium sp. PP-F2F-G48]